MKAGLTTSVVLHAALLGVGLFSLQAPRPFEVSDIESLPIDIVPIEEITKVQKGDKKAPAAEKPAPLPTERPDIVPDAQEIGENSVDTNAPPTPEAKPRPVETAAIPAPSPKPELKPAEEPEEAPPAESKPAAVPATEMTPQPQPKQEVKPDPVAETIVSETAEAEAVKLPETAPSPEARPQPPKAQTAKAPDRKDAENPVKQAAAKPKSEEKEFDADEVAALLNKEKASGGGAKRSTETAALGGKKTNSGEKLSQNEMDALRQRLAGCWSIPAGVDDAALLRVSVRFTLDRQGNLESRPEIVSGGGSSGPARTAAESAVRAVQKCEPFNLPADKYETWAEVIVNFDPSEMLGF